MPRPSFDQPIAHRGLHDRAGGVIENSASAFDAAIAAGYAIECDLQLSKDGVPIVFHDDKLERLVGRPGKPIDYPAAELTAMPLTGSGAGDCPQRFTEMLAKVGGRTLLQVELKRQHSKAATASLAGATAKALATYSGPVAVESFDPSLLTEVRKAGYRGPLGIISYRYDEPEWDGDLTRVQRFVLRNLLHFPWTRFDFMSIHERALDLAAVRFFRALGQPATAWTIRSAAAARAAISTGADQIVFEGFDARSA
jgi:glycerophosphoryl diester phosphodiesterase